MATTSPTYRNFSAAPTRVIPYRQVRNRKVNEALVQGVETARASHTIKAQGTLGFASATNTLLRQVTAGHMIQYPRFLTTQLTGAIIPVLCDYDSNVQGCWRAP